MKHTGSKGVVFPGLPCKPTPKEGSPTRKTQIRILTQPRLGTVPGSSGRPPATVSRTKSSAGSASKQAAVIHCDMCRDSAMCLSQNEEAFLRMVRGNQQESNMQGLLKLLSAENSKLELIYPSLQMGLFPSSSIPFRWKSP